MAVAVRPEEREDFKAQAHAVSSIRAMRLNVKQFKEEYGELPLTLEEVRQLYGADDRYFVDGWGREILYYRSENHYLLCSFGKNGTPEQQAAKPGGVVAERNYDTDIIMLNGEWVQTPRGVAR
jgi:hypothetical protein